MTRQVILDILGWALIAVVVLGGVLLSVKARQARVDKQRKKAERIWNATARYHEATVEELAAVGERPLSDVEELEKCFHSEPSQDEE